MMTPMNTRFGRKPVADRLPTVMATSLCAIFVGSFVGCSSEVGSKATDGRLGAPIGLTSSKNMSQAAINQSNIVQDYKNRILIPWSSGDLSEELRLREEFLLALREFPYLHPAVQANQVRIAVIHAKLGHWTLAHQKFGDLAPSGIEGFSSVRSTDKYWHREACKRTGDTAGLAAMRRDVRNQAVVIEGGLSLTGLQLVGQGVHEDDLLDLVMGLSFINSGEDGEEGLARGKALVAAVADKHPTNGFVNFGVAKALGAFPQNEKYTRRAFRHGSAAIRAELMRVKSGMNYRWANQEAKRMGLPYDHKAVPAVLHIRNIGDGTTQDTRTELPDPYRD